MNGRSVAAKLAGLSGLHDRIAQSHPKLSRGRVWCLSCGATQSVDPAHSLRHGWPLCCGRTMTIDSPEERTALTDEASHEG